MPPLLLVTLVRVMRLVGANQEEEPLGKRKATPQERLQTQSEDLVNHLAVLCAGLIERIIDVLVLTPRTPP